MPKLVQTIIGTNKEDVVNATILNKGQAPPRLLSSSYIVYQFLLKKSILFLKIYYKFLTVQKRKEDVISDTALQNEERTRLVSPSIYSIPDFIEKINPQDENFFKYIPNSFLSEEQKQAKANILTSTYGKENFENFLKNIALTNSLIYWDKEKSQRLSVNLGIQFPNIITSLRPNIIIHQAKAFVNMSTTKKSKPLNDEDPPIADNNEKHSQDKLRATLETKVANVVDVLKINQKEKISSTVTPQQAFDDMRDLSINSIPENFEKVNTSDEKNP